MKVRRLFIFSLLVILFTGQAYAQKKRAQTSMKFLSVSTSARAAAMGNAVTALDDLGSMGALYNPATLANYDGTFDVNIGNVEWIADINYNALTLLYKPKNNHIGAFGFNIISVDYGDILSTVVDKDAPLAYRDNGTINPTSVVFGFAYANPLNERLSIGANFRYVIQDLTSITTSYDATSGESTSEDYKINAGVLDFGIHYKTGYKSLKFAMALRNFSPEVTYDEDESELPLTFKIGISMNVFDLTNIDPKMHSLLISIDANRPRDFDEQLFIGAEYTFLNRFSLRGGYIAPNEEEDFSFGGGINQPFGDLKLSVDYAYTKFGVFGEVHRFGFKLDF